MAEFVPPSPVADDEESSFLPPPPVADDEKSSESLSAGISGITPVTSPAETPALSRQDPRYPAVMQAVGTGLQTAEAFARPFAVDFSTDVPGEERGAQLKAAEIERRMAEDQIRQRVGVNLPSVAERVAEAQRLSTLIRKEQGLRNIQSRLHAQSPEGQREALAAYMGPLYEQYHGSAEGKAPGLAATGFAKVAEGVLGMSAAAGEALGMSEAAQAMRADMAGFEQVAQQTKGTGAEVVRGIAGVVPLVVGLPEGKAGAVQAAARAAAQAYSSTLNDTGDTTAAYDAAIQTAPEMAAFMAVGRAAGKGVSAMLPKDARAMTAGLANFAGAEVANVGVSNVLRAIHGQEYDLSNFSADTLFALYHGVGGYKGQVDQLARERAAAKLRSYGWSQQQIEQPFQAGAETPATILLKAPEETRPFPREGLMDKAAMDAEILKQQTGEPNAEQISSAAQIHGDVLNREGTPESPGQVPPDVRGEGVPPRGQGEELAGAARSEAPQEVSISEIVPAIRAGNEVIRGNPGEEHRDILNRLKETDVEKFLSAQETFGKDNFFVDASGKEYSREQLKEKFGVSHSQDLAEAQRAANEPVKAYVEAPNISAAEAKRRASVAKEIESPLFRSEPLPAAEGRLRSIEVGETGGIFTRSKAPPKVKPIGAPPSGSARWLKIEPWWKRPGFEREGASLILQQRQENPIGKALGRATDKQFDVQDELQGKMWKKMDDATRGMSSKEQDAAFDELAKYTREKENGRPVPTLSPLAQKLLTAWQDIAEFTGLLAQAKGVKVAAKGGYRPMRLIGREYVPRMFDPEFLRTIRDPNANPAAFNQYVADLAAKWGVTPDVAAKELNDMAGGKGRLATSDFMGNIELARGEKLPESFYDYDMRRVIARYVDGYSRRMGQIIAYGQRLMGPRGPVQKNLWDLARDEVQGGDKTTAQWINEAEAQSTGERQVGGMGKFGQRLQSLATGLLLANPTSTVPRNLLSGLETATELMGTRRTIRAAVRALTSAGERLNAKETGAVKDDMAALLHAEQLQGDGKVDAGIRWLTSTMLKVSGYDISERMVRTTNFLAGSQFARDAAAALKSNPNGRKARQMAGLIERMGVSPDDIVRENGDWKTGDQTRRFIRAVIGQSQGGYRFNQVPLWAGTAAGRFFYQFGRWGTQRAQNLWNNVFKPAFVGTESKVNGVKMSVRDFKPLVRMGLGTVALGESFALIAQVLLGRDRRDASLTEIGEAFSHSTQLGIRKALSRAINDVIMSGSLGIWGQPVDLARAAKDQSRLKNPAEPPGGAGARAAIELVQNLIDQGTLTGDDVKRFAQSFVPGVSATVDVARNALDQPKYEAENDQRTLRMAGLRFADDKKLDVNRGGSDQSRKTENTPLFAGIRDALLVGDVAKAKQLKAQYLRQFSGGKKRDDAMQGLRNSVVGRQPFRVGPFTNDKVKEAFYKWAKKNLPKDDLVQVIRVQARYERAAKAAKLWKSDED